MKKPAKKAAAPEKDSRTLLEEFLIDQLRDLYWAEKNLVKALPKMQKAATSEELATALGDHLTVTEEHVSRLEQVFELMNQPARAKKCEAMDGLLKEGDSIVKETDKDTATRDAAIIIACQKVEHYEIASYGGLTTLAKTIGRDDVADILGQTLSEEKEADELLSSIAESHINEEASQEAEAEE